MEIDEYFVHLSVQGSLFVLEKSLVLNYDWILCKIINGLIPWKRINDNVYYINCDATSFRCILNLLMHTDVSSVSDLSPIDFKILQRTKDYLMIDEPNLNSVIDNYVGKETEKDCLLEKLRNKFDRMKREKDDLNSENKFLVNQLMEKGASYDELKKKIKDLKEDIEDIEHRLRRDIRKLRCY